MKNTIITILSLLVAVTVIAYGYEFIFNKPIIESPTIQENTNTLPQAVELKEQHIGSTYTFVGTLQVPTPCHTLATKVNKISEAEYQIAVTTVAPAAGVVCVQVVTDKQYKVSFSASTSIKVTTLIDGVVYEVNRFVIPDGENIDTFKLEIKG